MPVNLTASRLAEFRRRRRLLMQQMGEGSIALLPAARPAMRSHDTEYPYRQDSNVLYLSGFDEPEALLVLVPGRKAGQFIVFLREKDPEKETWHGLRLGVDEAPEALGADDAFPIDDVDDILPGLLEGKQHVYHTLGKDAAFDTRLFGWLQKSRQARRGSDDPDTFISLDHHLNEMRLIKSRGEIALMKKAATLTAAGHLRAMQQARPGQYEYEVAAELGFAYTAGGGAHAFLPIVGGGANGCILHYTENRSKLRKQDLVLVDSGAEVDGYAGDVTRTWPVSDTFSPKQRAVYELVLDAQQAAIESIAPGRTWNEPHDAATRVITAGLRDLGVLKGNIRTLMKNQAWKPYFMHGTGHWLGLDVHDVGSYKVDGEPREFEPGMVLTVEPGLYLNRQRGLPASLRGIGVRIEDNIQVTHEGIEVLTAAIPKSVEALETIRGEALQST